MGDKGDKNAARPPEGSLVETRCLIKGPKSAIVPFPGPRSGPKSRTGPGALAGSVPGRRERSRREKIKVWKIIMRGEKKKQVNEREREREIE